MNFRVAYGSHEILNVSQCICIFSLSNNVLCKKIYLIYNEGKVKRLSCCYMCSYSLQVSWAVN